MNGFIKRLFQVCTRTKHILVAWVLLNVGEIAVFCWAVWEYTASGRYTNALQASYSAVPFAFALFIYLGYELTVLLHENNLWESFRAIKQLNKVAYGLLGIIGMLASITFLFALLFNSSFYCVVNGGLAGILFRNLIASHMLYYFLTPLAGGVLGIFFAIYLKQKRIIVYIITIILVLLNTSYLERVFLLPLAYTHSDQMTKALFAVKDFCTLSPLGLKENFIMDPIYGMPIEMIRWLLVFLWVSLPLGCILWKTIGVDRTRLVCVAGCGFVTLICLVGYIPPGSRVVLDNRPTSYTNADQFYYLEQADTSSPFEQVGFTIKNYRMNVNILKVLKASVTMELEISQSDLKELVFTLYHNYHVKKVVNANNESIPFYQKGDWFYVDVSGIEGQEPVITVHYEGYSPKFYSNSQAIALPGYFPYYPQEGNKKVWDIGLAGFDIAIPEDEKDFEVSVNTAQKVYTNLEGEGNRFFGTSRMVSLFAGMLEEIDEIVGPPAINRNGLSLSRSNLAEVQQLIKRVENKIGRSLDLPDLKSIRCFSKPDIFITSQTDFVVLLGDHLITQYPGSKDIVSEILMTKLGSNMFNNNYLTQLINHALGEEAPSSEGDMRQPAEQHLSQMERYLDMDDVDKLMNFASMAMPATQYLLWLSPNAEANEQALWKVLLDGENGDPSETVTELLRQEVQGTH